MAKGSIPRSAIEEIREAIAIEDVVGEYVQLTPAGTDSLKGLSPFKDEKTPSFHVRPNAGYFHCFSTDEHGDVYKFLQLVEHLTFPEAVELAAEKIGYQIRYEGGGSGRRQDIGLRQRLVAANKDALKFYQQRFYSDDAEAKVARDFLKDRGFTREHAELFGCGFAPGGWDTLTKHLVRAGHTIEDLTTAGLTKKGKRGPIDTFTRRLLWPIRSETGDVIGFGARRLFDDDMPAKYLNTPETPLYKKSKVLFGLDQAKKSIASTHRAIVVEGYTDVMAMHAAGVTTAVAACGTAFGDDHLQKLRRYMLDDREYRGEVIYMFDGDEAGQKAAMRAFAGSQRLTGRSYVTVADDGKDPCDVRLAHGDEAVRQLVDRRVPMFEFVIRNRLAPYDLRSVDARVNARREIVPILAHIKDETLRREYARKASGWIAWDNPAEIIDEVEAEVRKAAHSATRLHLVSDNSPKRGAGQKQEGPKAASGEKKTAENRTDEDRPSEEGSARSHLRAVGDLERPDPQDFKYECVREVLKLAIQSPQSTGEVFDLMPRDSFIHPTYIAIASAIESLGGVSHAKPGPAWVTSISEAVDDVVGSRVVGELAVDSVHCSPERMAYYADAVMARMQEKWMRQQIALMRRDLQLMPDDMTNPDYAQKVKDIYSLEKYRRQLDARAADYGGFTS